MANYPKAGGHYCDILVLFYCVTTGDSSSEMLGSDESDLVVIVWQLLDLNKNQVSFYQHYLLGLFSQSDTVLPALYFFVVNKTL